jgi:hypothetical protein
MVRSNPAETFEWPPAEDVLTGQAFELASEGVHSTQQSSESVRSDDAASRRGASPAPIPSGSPQQGEVQAKRHRGLEQRAWAAKLSGAAKRLPRSWSRVSSRIVPVALVAVAVTALLEGVYIVRTLRLQPTSATADSTQMVQAEGGSRTEAAPQPAMVVAPKITADPGSTNVADVEGPRPPPETGRLVVRSDPPGAQVFVNGQLYGVTPLTLGTVRTGEHRIVLKRDATELQQIVRVEPGSTVSVVVLMQSSAPAVGWIAIASPAEVDVFEDGALLGTSRSRQIMLEAGPHRLELVNDNLGYRHTQQVSVRAGRTERITIALPQSTINLNALPWGEVLIDGKSVGETPIANLPIVIGTHEIVFRHPELGEKRVSATVQAGVLTRVSADLRQPPSVSR